MKKLSILIISFIFVLPAFADNIPIDVARTVAKNFYYEKSNIKQNQINFDEQTVLSNDIVSFYVFNTENNQGFVIVAAEDNYVPILAYSLTNYFETENQPENVIQLWVNYSKPFNLFQKDNLKDVVVEPLTDHIKWNQDSGWNELCPADANGPGGHVYAGCVATAMAIVMKYWNYPIQGSGSHGYTPSGYDYQFADYENTTYFWSYMDDTRPNYYSALLQYHLGVSVDMMYSPDGSGAYSHDVPDALENYFGYSSSIEFLQRNNYSDPEWITVLQEQLNQALPMYYSGCSNSGCHAFVCDGYDSDNYFHFNFGWGGSNNGFYLLDNVGGYSQWNGVVRNIIPAVDYLEPVAYLDAELDFNNQNTVNIQWDASLDKNITSYTLYRNDVIIAEDISTSTSSYIDNDVQDGDYFYGIRAVFSDGQAICASDFIEVKNSFDITFQVMKNNNSFFSLPYPTVIFNGETKTVNLIGQVTFENVPLGINQNYIANHTDYDPINGFIDVNYDKKVILYFEEVTSIDNFQSKISVYPNPSPNGIFRINGVYENLLISVYDIIGKKVYNDNLIDHKINLSNLQKGIYLLKIQNNDQFIYEKIIIE